jgi:hypothetical protein
MRITRGCVCIVFSVAVTMVLGAVGAPVAFASGPSVFSASGPAVPTGPDGTPVPDASEPSSSHPVSDPAGTVTPDSGSCWTAGTSPLQNYPINTQENLCMVNDQGYVCNFSAAYGNFLGVAYVKLMLDSGYCDTNSSYSDDQVDAYYIHSGTEYGSTAYGPYSFGSWTQANGSTSSSIFEGQWVVCMEITVGDPSAGDQCLVLSSSPL